MKKIIKLFALLCFSAFILSACAGSDSSEKPVGRIVTKVDVIYKRNNMLLQRHYTDNEKMESILFYLRSLQPKAIPDTLPELSYSDICQITVHLSDGQKRVYRQSEHRYFSADFSPWKSIKPEKAYELYTLLRQMPGDVSVYANLWKI